MYASSRFIVFLFCNILRNYGLRNELLIGSPYEFDVPKCSSLYLYLSLYFCLLPGQDFIFNFWLLCTGGAGVPGCELVNNTWIHTITGNRLGNDRPYVYLNFHCHAPTCINMAVYMCEEGVAVEDCNTTNGELLCEQRPVYGGTGDVLLNGTKFDEPGYIATAPCLWGDPQFGLEVYND